MFLLSSMKFLIVSILEKVFKFLSSLSEKEQGRRPKFAVEWKFLSRSSKFKVHGETQTIGINAFNLGSKIAVTIMASL